MGLNREFEKLLHHLERGLPCQNNQKLIWIARLWNYKSDFASIQQLAFLRNVATIEPTSSHSLNRYPDFLLFQGTHLRPRIEL